MISNELLGALACYMALTFPTVSEVVQNVKLVVPVSKLELLFFAYYI